ncbi:MAG: uracil phosphoribosyltransferase [Actinobacteria bacterium]|nr:uracil phosphoribosyltransferase [Actinomycetota bacterium]
MPQLHVVNHPLLQHKLTLMRDKTTGSKEFRELLREATIILVTEATRNLRAEEVRVETPLAETTGVKLSGKKATAVPILRAGLAMVEGFLQLLPNAKIGHVGLYRDPVTHKPVEYYFKVPACLPERDVFILDPMLATGGSAVQAINFIKQAGARSITLICLIAAPEGMAEVEKAHPEVAVYTAAVDEHLDERAFIVPGLGDAGDRLYGTE